MLVASEAVPAPRCELVVDQEPGTDITPLPDVGKREQEGDGPHQMRRHLCAEQVPLTKSLSDDADVEVLEIAKASVNQSGRPARCALAKVSLLDQGNLQAPRSCIKGDASACDATTHNQQIELFGVEPLDAAQPGVGAEDGATARTCRLHDPPQPISGIKLGPVSEVRVLGDRPQLRRPHWRVTPPKRREYSPRGR